MVIDADRPQSLRCPLIIVPGALGVADGGGNTIERLRSKRDILSLRATGQRTFSQIEEDVFELLEPYHGQADIIGFSIGGWFAQCLAARHPARFRRIVLAHSFILDPQQARLFSLAIRLWPLVPRAIFRTSALRRAKAALAPLKRRAPEQYLTVMSQLESDLRSAESVRVLLGQQQATRDTLRHGSCLAPQPMLIIESDNDPIVGRKERDKLSRAYPLASKFVLHDTGHAGALVDPVNFSRRVEAFLDSD